MDVGVVVRDGGDGEDAQRRNERVWGRVLGLRRNPAQKACAEAEAVSIRGSLARPRRRRDPARVFEVAEEMARAERTCSWLCCSGVELSVPSRTVDARLEVC